MKGLSACGLIDDRVEKHLFCCCSLLSLEHYTSSRCLHCWFLDQTFMWGRAANVLHLFGKRWQELMELSEDGGYRCVSLPDVHVGEPLHLLFHVLQKFSWTQQHLTDGADGSLTVIEWHLLLTWEKNRKIEQEKMRFIYNYERVWEVCRHSRFHCWSEPVLLLLTTTVKKRQNPQSII